VKRELGAGRRVMGFGHRIYRTYDPRARIHKNIAEKLAEERGGSRKWLDIAEEVERIVMDKRKLWPNIEFYAAVVLNALGVPKDLDRKSTRLNSSHQIISYAVFCLKKKKHKQIAQRQT